MADPTGAEIQRNMAWMRGNLEKTPKGMNPDIANMVRDVRGMYFPGETRPVGATPAMQSAVQGQPLPAVGEPVRPAPAMRTLAQGVAPQGQPRGYSGMAWSAPTATEMPGLGPQSATPDLTNIYNSPVGPKRPAPTMSDMIQKMGAPQQPKGFWDAATMGGMNPQTATPAEDATTLGKLAGAAGIFGRGAAAATSPVTLAGVVGAPLAAYFGQKELPASYARGHQALVPGAAPQPHQAGGSPAADAFGRMRQLTADNMPAPADTSAPAARSAAIPAPAESLGRQITVRRGTQTPQAYSLDPQGNVTGPAQAGGGAGLTPAEQAYNTNLARAMELENQRQETINSELRYQLSGGEYGLRRPRGVPLLNALMGGKAAVSGTPLAPPKLKPPSEADLLTRSGRESLGQIDALEQDFATRAQQIRAAHPDWTSEQIAADPGIRQNRLRKQQIQDQFKNIIELSGKKLPTLDQVLAGQYRGE